MVSLNSRQVMILPRKTKTYVTWSGPEPPCGPSGPVICTGFPPGSSAVVTDVWYIYIVSRFYILFCMPVISNKANTILNVWRTKGRRHRTWVVAHCDWERPATRLPSYPVETQLQLPCSINKWKFWKFKYLECTKLGGKKSTV